MYSKFWSPFLQLPIQLRLTAAFPCSFYANPMGGLSLGGKRLRLNLLNMGASKGSNPQTPVPRPRLVALPLGYNQL